MVTWFSMHTPRPMPQSSPIVTFSRTKAWSPMTVRAPMVLPANTTAPEHTVTLSAITRPGSSFFFAVERLASFGLLPSTTLS